MAALQQQEIAAMGWDTLEATLLTSTRGLPRGAADEQPLQDYFGQEEYRYLQQLAGQTRGLRSQAPTPGHVVLIPGIMGSQLTAIDSNGQEDPIWMNLGRLALGQMAQLVLQGPESSTPSLQIKASGIDKRTYTRAILWLRARWNVHSFAFDWRQDIDHAADALATFIRETFAGQPVHLVAHSMGGLVARNFIRRHRELWNRMRQADLNQGGRLIMLGTPNFGSYAIPQALTGVEPLVRLLAAADLRHNLSELLAILNTFVGTYQLLPAPSKIPVATQA